MLFITRSEFENAALALGFKSATLRQWRHRGKVPGDAKVRLINFFDAPFQIIPRSAPSTKRFFRSPANRVGIISRESHQTEHFHTAWFVYHATCWLPGTFSLETHLTRKQGDLS